MNDNIIEIKNVSMLFNLGKEKVDNIKEYIVKLIKGQLMFEEFWALKNISLNIKRGQSYGFVGLNGSGKSTLLKIIAGVLKPTKGSVSVYGTVAPLIELGAGFDPDLSARENIFLNGAVLGYSKVELQKKFNEIVEFAELWEFLDVPIKNYSSGMVARLGFSIATISQPDILIVDEILEVGDYTFKKKCENRIDEMVSKGTTVILVSHSIERVRKMCQSAAWLQKGELAMYGDVHDVCKEYMNQD